ncbi:MAG: zinc ribbon domain-containing protein [Bacillota bacterium]
MNILHKVKRGMLDSTKLLKEVSSEMTEMTRLKVSLSKEKSKLEDLYYDLGKTMFEQYKDREAYVDFPLEVINSLQEIKDVFHKINEYAARIDELQGIVKCIQCGNIADENDKFCSSCGTKFPEPKQEYEEVESIEADIQKMESIDPEVLLQVDDETKDEEALLIEEIERPED